MDDKSIRGFATAGRMMEDALRGHLDGEKLTNMFDRFCENPVRGIAEYYHLISVNHLLTPELSGELMDALRDVDDTEPGHNGLTTEEQGTLILAWAKAGKKPPHMYSVKEAADYLGIGIGAVRKAIYRGRLDASRTPPSSRWYISQDALDAYRDGRSRGIAEDGE